MAEANSSNAALGLHHNAKNLLGMTFGNFTVIAVAGKAKRGGTLWLCQCGCGNQRSVPTSELTAGRHRSCGCTALAANIAKHTTHGFARTDEYKIWERMISRCHNPQDSSFSRYGDRGIEVCTQWRESFTTFLADMGNRPSRKHSLDRYPNQNGNYEPANVRWATSTEQGRNKRTNHLLTHNGETLSVAEWAEKLGLKRWTIHNRLKYGWSVERALSTDCDARTL